MARHASTYRKLRREMARILQVDWKTFNSLEYWRGEDALKLFQSIPDRRPPFIPNPSKDYRGKLGAKDQSRHYRAINQE